MGIRSAQSDYKRSAEDWISNAPEYLCTVRAYDSILRELKTLDKQCGSASGFITLECPSTYVGRIVKRGPKTRNSLTARSRVDLFLWAASGTPRAVIEIKRDFRDSKGIRDDIERIRQFLLYCDQKTVFGVFSTIVYKDVGRMKTVSETIDSVWAEIERVRESVTNSAVGLSCSPHYAEPEELNVVDDNGTSLTRLWCPLCFSLRRSRRSR
jgi:hypothetical protein